jgi:cell division protein FtsN
MPEKPASKGGSETGAVVKKEPSVAASKQAKQPAVEKKEHDAVRTSPTSAVPQTQGKNALPRKVTAEAKDKVVEKPGKIAAGEAAPVSKKQETFTLVVGTYVLKTTVLADKAKLEKAGLRPVINVGRKRNETMNRLVVAEFASYSSAHAELGRVKKVSKDAFVLHNNGRYVVYAGSYYRTDRAIEEVERLKKHGVSPVVKKSAAPVSSYTLTVGDFPTREAARKGEDRLKKLGFKPFLSTSYRK